MCVFAIDKTAFGGFLAERRKEMGYTQKDLSAKLFVSDKAVSKWERGLSLPDVSLLIPLAEILGVTVSELLEGRRLDDGAGLDTEQVDKLVKKAITLSGDSPEKQKEKRRKAALIFTVCAAAALAEMLLILHSGRMESTLLTLVLMSFGFGIYFWFLVKDRLPTYYDENKISAYSSGPLRINIPGLHFNNSNWPHIVRALRIWAAAGMAGLPFIFLLLGSVVPGLLDTLSTKMVLLFLYLGGLFIPLYIVGKKYE